MIRLHPLPFRSLKFNIFAINISLDALCSQRLVINNGNDVQGSDIRLVEDIAS
jgi:hypothetical protein